MSDDEEEDDADDEDADEDSEDEDVHPISKKRRSAITKVTSPKV